MAAETDMPAHLRLSLWVREQIDQGHLQPGDRLPSEHELAAQHDVSRTTVRRALQSLESANRVHRRRGAGTYVSNPQLRQGVGDLRSFTQVIRDLGREPSTRDVTVEIDPDPPVEAREFLPGSLLWLVRRLRLADEEIYSVSYSWLPDSVGRKLDADTVAEKTSLYRVLEEDFGVRIIHAREAIRAEAAGREDAALLQIPERTPLITIYRWTSDARGAAVEYGRAASPGDRHEYVVTRRRD